ncbi:hypothetical protein U3516DRAFT_750647 [Neocallimastix sp. 'constans']|jgi:hypothetical protein
MKYNDDTVKYDLIIHFRRENKGRKLNQIWTTLEKSFNSILEKRKQDFKDKINNFKFNGDQDINIFMVILQNIIEEYISIDHDIDHSIKADIINRAFPENLRFINVFQYIDNWGRLSNYIKDVIPDIVLSNMKEHSKIEDSQKHIFLTEQNIKSNNKKEQEPVKHNVKKMEDITSVVGSDTTLMSAQNVIDIKIINIVDIQNQGEDKV